MLTCGIPPDFRDGVHLYIQNRHTPSGQSRVYRVTRLRTDGVHYRESAVIEPVVIKVFPLTGAAFVSPSWCNQYPPVFSHTHYTIIGMKWVSGVPGIYILSMKISSRAALSGMCMGHHISIALHVTSVRLCLSTVPEVCSRGSFVRRHVYFIHYNIYAV